MRLHRIRIRNFRGVADCEVRFPETGLTVVKGPNEAGKTSLAIALDLILWEADSSTKQKVKAVKPVHRDAGPEAEVELTTGEYRVEYFKRWAKRPETRLSVLAPHAEQLTGREAHERMCQILEKTLDRALFGALRFVQGSQIEQGSVGDSPTLMAALDRAAEGAADPEAESTLFEAIQKEWLEYFTPSGKKSRQRADLDAVVAKDRVELDAARDALARLEQTGESYRSVLAALEDLTTRREEALSEQGEAAAAKGALGELERRVDERSRAVNDAAAAEEKAQDAKKIREGLIESVDTEQRAIEELRVQIEALAPMLSEAERQGAEAKVRHEAAEKERDAAIEAVKVASADREFRQAQVSRQLLERRVVQVEQAWREEAEALAVVETSKVTPKARDEVEGAAQALLEAKATRDAQSPSVELRGLSAVQLEHDGEALRLDAGDVEQFVVTGETTIDVAGLLEVRVRGGGTVEDLEEAVVGAEKALAALVERYGLDPSNPSGDLQTKLDGLRDARKDRKAAQDKRDEALGDLTEAQLVAKLDEARALVERYPNERMATSPLPEDVETAKAVYQSAEQRVRDAEAPLKALIKARDVTRDGVTERRVEVERAKGLRADREKRLTGAKARLDEARGVTDDQSMTEALADAREHLRMAREALESASRELAVHDPEGVRARLANADALVERLSHEHRDLEEQKIALAATLQAKGADDLQAAIDAAEAAFAVDWQRHEEIERRAQAVALLRDTFLRHRDAARLAYVGPYREQIERLAKLVFGPEVRIAVDPEDFSVTHRALDGVVLPFDYLSVGAQEQLGVLARLACAALVSTEGTDGDVGAPVILDDALGYTDKDRLRALAPAFAEAAKHAQVIVMTSTPERYERVGNATVIGLPTRAAAS